MGKTINGLAATEGNRQRNYSIRDETGKEQMMITAAAERLGRTPQWLYGLMRQGKVRTQYVGVGRKRYQVIPDTEFERLKRELEPKTLRRKLIESLASARGVCEKSARRWVERQEKQGRSTQELAEEMAEKIVQKRDSRTLQSDSTNADTD